MRLSPLHYIGIILIIIVIILLYNRIEHMQDVISTKAIQTAGDISPILSTNLNKIGSPIKDIDIADTTPTTQQPNDYSNPYSYNAI